MKKNERYNCYYPNLSREIDVRVVSTFDQNKELGFCIVKLPIVYSYKPYTFMDFDSGFVFGSRRFKTLKECREFMKSDYMKPIITELNHVRQTEHYKNLCSQYKYLVKKYETKNQ